MSPFRSQNEYMSKEIIGGQMILGNKPLFLDHKIYGEPIELQKNKNSFLHEKVIYPNEIVSQNDIYSKYDELLSLYNNLVFFLFMKKK